MSGGCMNRKPVRTTQRVVHILQIMTVFLFVMFFDTANAGTHKDASVPNGQAAEFIYSANQAAHDLTVYKIDSRSGALQPVEGSPYSPGRESSSGVGALQFRKSAEPAISTRCPGASSSRRPFDQMAW